MTKEIFFDWFEEQGQESKLEDCLIANNILRNHAWCIQWDPRFGTNNSTTSVHYEAQMINTVGGFDTIEVALHVEHGSNAPGATPVSVQAFLQRQFGGMPIGERPDHVFPGAVQGFSWKGNQIVDGGDDGWLCSFKIVEGTRIGLQKAGAVNVLSEIKRRLSVLRSKYDNYLEALEKRYLLCRDIVGVPDFKEAIRGNV